MNGNLHDELGALTDGQPTNLDWAGLVQQRIRSRAKRSMAMGAAATTAILVVSGVAVAQIGGDDSSNPDQVQITEPSPEASTFEDPTASPSVAPEPTPTGTASVVGGGPGPALTGGDPDPTASVAATPPDPQLEFRLVWRTYPQSTTQVPVLQWRDVQTYPERGPDDPYWHHDRVRVEDRWEWTACDGCGGSGSIDHADREGHYYADSRNGGWMGLMLRGAEPGEYAATWTFSLYRGPFPHHAVEDTRTGTHRFTVGPQPSASPAPTPTPAPTAEASASADPSPTPG